MEAASDYKSSIKMQNSILTFGLPVDENKNNMLK